MALSNDNEHETIAMFEGEEAKAFNAYARRESTPEEKEKLRKALYFYKRHCPSTPKKN
jgi:hypothetical protein